MKFSHHKQTMQIKNSDACIVTVHQLNDKRIDCAVIELKGRYPEEDRVTNQKCLELSYIMEGSGIIVVDGEEITLNVGDSILLETGEKYFWDGEMTMCVTCTPAWYPEQHQLVNEPHSDWKSEVSYCD